MNLEEESEVTEHLFKVLVVGEMGTGKTSIISRYVNNIFSRGYRATVGVDFALKVITWDPKNQVRLQLWDIAGQERFGHMTRVYYKEAVAALVVFDVTRIKTFEAAAKWKADIDSKVTLGTDNKPIPVVLLANKVDLVKTGGGVTYGKNAQEMDQYVQENGFVGWFETSAKDNVNIDEAVKCLLTPLMESTLGGDYSLPIDPKSPFPKPNDSSGNGGCCSN